MVWNQKQKQAIDKIYEFIDQNVDKIFYLVGYPGTGKTFLLASIIKELLLSKKVSSFYICAPTHQALNVIESNFKALVDNFHQIEFLTRISFMTIHKLLDFKPIIMAQDGSKIFKSSTQSKFLKKVEQKIVVVDECSMVPQSMVFELKKYTESSPVKIIYLGDKNQLNPVKEDESLIFSTIPQNYYYHILLDEIMRTKSPDIKEVCTIIRQWNQKDNLGKLLLPIHQKTGLKTFRLYHKKPDYLQTTWFKTFIKKMADGKIPIILTWTNAAADNYNQIIRQHVHKVCNLENYIVGDYVMFNNYYLSPKDNSSFYTSNMVKILTTKTEEIVLFDWMKIAVSPGNLADKGFNALLKKLDGIQNKFKVDIFQVKKIHSDTDSDNKEYLVQTINKTDQASYNKMVEMVQEHIEFFYKKYQNEKLATILWDAYYKKLVNPYANINFGYSTTTHKAQGTTFQVVYVDVRDIGQNLKLNEMKKCLYTAAGRAAEELGFLF